VPIVARRACSKPCSFLASQLRGGCPDVSWAGGVLEFRLLGPIEIEATIGHLVDIGPPRQRCVLAALAVDAGRPVMVESLVDRGWGESPSARVWQTIHVYVAQLRGILAGVLSGPRLVRRSRGYLLDIDPESVDVHRFHQFLARARASQDSDRVRVSHTSPDRPDFAEPSNPGQVRRASMVRCGVWANAPTRCSRPRTRPCVTIVVALGGWARSSGRRLSCCTTSTAEPHDPHGLIT
jgi:hypothetical protein